MKKGKRKMKKVFKLEDLDCANCAAKMEAAIKKLRWPHITRSKQKSILKVAIPKFYISALMLTYLKRKMMLFAFHQCYMPLFF